MSERSCLLRLNQIYFPCDTTTYSQDLFVVGDIHWRDTIFVLGDKFGMFLEEDF